MKKLFTFTFLLLYAFSVTTFAASTWDGISVSEEFSGGDGSERNPWQIHSPQDLALLSRQVNGGETFTGQYFVPYERYRPRGEGVVSDRDIR